MVSSLSLSFFLSFFLSFCSLLCFSFFFLIGVSRSPIYTHLSSTLSSLSTLFLFLHYSILTLSFSLYSLKKVVSTRLGLFKCKRDISKKTYEGYITQGEGRFFLFAFLSHASLPSFFLFFTLLQVDANHRAFFSFTNTARWFGLNIGILLVVVCRCRCCLFCFLYIFFFLDFIASSVAIGTALLSVIARCVRERVRTKEREKLTSFFFPSVFSFFDFSALLCVCGVYRDNPELAGLALSYALRLAGSLLSFTLHTIPISLIPSSSSFIVCCVLLLLI